MASAAEQLAANLSMSNLGKAQELRQRIVFTILALIVFRLGIQIPIPGVDVSLFSGLFAQQTGETGLAFLSQINRFTGGALGSGSIFTLSIIPYISASIIVTLLRAMIPSWDAMYKEGEVGRRQLNQYTRYLTLILALVQGMGIAVGLENNLLGGNVLVEGIDNPYLFRISAMLSMAGGTMFLLWLGEQITARGVGNGISLIIYIGIISGLPTLIFETFVNINDLTTLGRTALITSITIALIVLIVFVERCIRKVPVQYPSRVQGNRQIAGDKQFLPLKINTAGVIPAIFASSLLFLPQTILAASGSTNTWATSILAYLSPGAWTFPILFGFLIIFFAFFYTSIVFNPEDTAENLKKQGGSIPGIRPGKQTAAYLDFILSRLTVVGGLYLAFVALAPMLASSGDAASSAFFGGTAILIVVTVTIDLVSQVQSYLVANQYEAILQKQNLRGGPAGAGLGGDEPKPSRSANVRKRKPRKSNSR